MRFDRVILIVNSWYERVGQILLGKYVVSNIVTDKCLATKATRNIYLNIMIRVAQQKRSEVKL